METITVPKFVVNESKEAIRIAANILGSWERETAADRQIEFASRLLKWVLDGQPGEMPRWIPTQTSNPNKQDYLMSSNLKTDGMDKRWVELWQQIEIWYGDPKKLETCEQLLQRLQKLYSLTERVGGI